MGQKFAELREYEVTSRYQSSSRISPDVLVTRETILVNWELKKKLIQNLLELAFDRRWQSF